MEASRERISFIIEYISAYESKIKLANRNGLFDEAQLFELFAQEICGLWYGQKFINLNSIKKNYPCVDLLSTDGNLYIQVSTQKNIFEKIKTTLRALDNSDNPDLEKISAPIFFVLSYESESSVKDLVGEDQIGRFPFTVEKNLISTSKIVQRAITDPSFQIALYELIKQDIKGVETISDKLLEIFDTSRSIGLFNIDTTINGEYEIDRSAFVNRVKLDSNQFIFICGEAGSGKSVICKKILENEGKVFFVRADKLAKCHSIDDIWGININKAFSFLNGKRAVVYIDALEYLANAGESIKELIQTLLTEISRFPNLYFMASCRSCDKSAFIKLLGLFNVKEYTVDLISDDELKEICKRYPIIKEVAETDKYSELIRSPFYINEIVSRGVDFTKITDVNSFRGFIWKECICLQSKASQKGISTNELVSTVKRLVLERSKRFSIGVSEEEIDRRILELLRSNNVITDKDDLVRLKYDIYEDICFERIFDEEFDSCKGVYTLFFTNIDKMGNGVYRRYQIWISNKLLTKENRDKFLHALVFDEKISNEWHRNTIIGLIKSPFCMSFFKEQGASLIEKNLILEFVDIANCFSFEMDDVFFNKIKSICWLKLKAIGNGRIALINLIFENKLYRTDYLDKRKLIKLCKDYAIRSMHVEETDEHVCAMISYYVDVYMNAVTSTRYHRINEYLYSMLSILYALPLQSSSWISGFWDGLNKKYLEGNSYESRIAEEILSWTLEHATAALVDEKLEGLLDVATILWTKEKKRNRQEYDSYGYRLDDEYLWGIRGVGENYNYTHRSVENDIFLRLIFHRRFEVSIKWAIELINQMVSEYSTHRPEDLIRIVIFDCDDYTEKEYLGSGRMWLVGREESIIPTLIGDLIYWLKESTIHILSSIKSNIDVFKRMAQYIKTVILEKSTSIIPFTIIEEIGLEFAEIIPGYAALLASSLDILFWDIQWVAHNMHSPAEAVLVEQIKMAVGIPSLDGRYPERKYKYHGLQNYMVWAQILGDDSVREKCEAVFDYLYMKIDSGDAHSLLQVQKMDMRNAAMSIHDNNIITIEPRLSDEAQQIVDFNETKKKTEEEIVRKLKQVSEDNNLETALEELNTIKLLMVDPLNAINYEIYYIMYICIALKNQNLSKTKRSELVCDWVGRIENVFTHKAGYVADFKLSEILIQQYWGDIDKVARNRLKDLILLCLTNRSSDGHISLLKRIILLYLSKNAITALVFFNTIIAIAGDEWEHSRYNNEVQHKNKGKQYCISGGNGVPKPDDIIRAMGVEPFKSKREELVQRFLYDEDPLDMNEINVYEIDPGFLFDAINTGIRLENPSFLQLIKRMMPIFIKSMDGDEQNSFMDYYFERMNVKEMFVRELTDDKGDFRNAVDLLFDDDLINSIRHETAKMYQSIYGQVVAVFFDSFNDSAKRMHCCKCIKYTEAKINKIQDLHIKNQLEKILVLGKEPLSIDWNECETHYSYEDKIFICELWKKHYHNHENDILRALYQLKIGELLPEVLPIICKIVDSLKHKGDEIDDNSRIILKTLILKALLDFSDKIKSDLEYHESYEKILNVLIDFGDESAAVILDEYRTH